MKNGKKGSVNLKKLRSVLALQGVPEWRLAARMGISPARLSRQLNRRETSMPDLVGKIAKALGVSRRRLANRCDGQNPSTKPAETLAERAA